MGFRLVFQVVSARLRASGLRVSARVLGLLGFRVLVFKGYRVV